MTSDLAHDLLYDMARRVPDDLINFGRAMWEGDFVGDDVWYFLTRAEKWADAYTAWTNAGKPSDATDDGWDEFAAAAEAATA